MTTPDTMDAPFNMDVITKQAAKAADKASHSVVSEPDKGKHLSQEDIWEEELKQAGWKPLALHPHSPVWLSPEGLKYPGPGAAWLTMKEKQRESTE